MIDGGVFIFFAEPVPEELAELSVIHEPEDGSEVDVRQGDRLTMGASTAAVTAVGERAAENLRTLGHLVVYVNPGADTGLLPGAIHVTGEIAEPKPGDVIELQHAPV